MYAYPKMIKAGLIVTMLLIAAAVQAAGNVTAGAEKAKGCAMCHGIDGKGSIRLAGKKADYLAEQLKAFKSGARVSDTMNAMTSNLSEQDIADLAAYFSSK